jgi:ArsR family transcriptional regulator
MTTSDIELQARALKALGDPVRWRIAAALRSEELCVCHLTEDLGISQSLLSHHLRVLVRAGLVEGEQSSYWTYYRLRPTAFSHLADGISTLLHNRPPRPTRRPCPPPGRSAPVDELPDADRKAPPEPNAG